MWAREHPGPHFIRQLTGREATIRLSLLVGVGSGEGLDQGSWGGRGLGGSTLSAIIIDSLSYHFGKILYLCLSDNFY